MNEIDKRTAQLLGIIPQLYVCPRCRGALTVDSPQQISCQACRQTYPVLEGVPIFALHLYDEFYEKRHWDSLLEMSPAAPLKEKIKFGIFYLFSLSLRRRYFFKRRLKNRKGLVLDVGCGGGKQLYRQVGPVIGIDICLSALNNAKKIYTSVAQADALALPFADGIFDHVVSSDLIEHIPLPQKDVLLKEMWRVLKPGGRLVHEAETLSRNYLYRFAQKDMDLFFKYFVIEISGHFGLEPATDLLKRLEKLGTQKIRVEPIYDLLWPLNEYGRLFGPEYRQKSLLIDLIVRAADALSSQADLKMWTETFLGLVSKIRLIPRPLNNAKVIGFSCEKGKT